MSTLLFIFFFVEINFSLLYGAPITESNNNDSTLSPDPQISLKNASDYLIKYGYLSPTQSRSAQTPESLSAAIERFQRYAGLNVTGVLDNDTLALMSAPRCQVPDVTPNGQRYALAPMKWDTTRLSYKILNSPSKTYNIRVPSEIETIMSTSFDDWSSVSRLTFVPTSISTPTSRPNINIGFYSYNHNDGSSFDGKGGTLAHAFFPRDGRLHFDDSETWSASSRNGTNFRQVATHELGHILGLGHSSVRAAVMYPYYPGYNPNFALDRDDILGIQNLYGPNSATTNTTNNNSMTVPTTTTPFINPESPNRPRPNSATTSTTNNNSMTVPTTTTPFINTESPNRPNCGFKCAKFDFCIPTSYICDGDNDCLDNSDEADCAVSSTTSRSVSSPTSRSARSTFSTSSARSTFPTRPISSTISRYPTRFRRTTRFFIWGRQ